MAGKQSGARQGRVGFDVSTAERPEFSAPLVAYVFDANGRLIEQADVKSGRVDLALDEKQLARSRVFLAPRIEGRTETELTPAALERVGAYEPVLRPGGKLIDTIVVPGIIIDVWPICFCWVRGQVVRGSDNRPVCGARVHICEVDPVPIWILRLPDPELFRLRDDLIEVLRNPPIPVPQPDPAPFGSPVFRFAQSAAATKLQRAALNPQPLPPKAAASIGRAAQHGGHVSLNPQPLPPRTGSAAQALRHGGSHVAFNPQPEPPVFSRSTVELTAGLQAGLLSPSATLVRQTLAANWQILVPYLCLWPWWWWWFRCDEVAVVTTDSHGRFEAVVIYPCFGDRPDLYFWVEFDFGSGFETVYHPPIACNTHWNYTCGTEVTLRVWDARVPGCGGPGDLPGCQVVVLSLGNGVAVREVQTDAGGAATEGLTTAGEPFGGTLEPRFDCSRTELIVNRSIPYYRWSIRRLSGPDGVGNVVDPSSPAIGVWTILTRDVYRHYELGTSYPSVLMGPLPTAGPPPIAPIPNLFSIQPADPPAGPGWDVLNEHIDLATAYFDTASLAGAPTSGPTPIAPAPDDLAAGRYELKLELFDDTGALVNWTQRGVDLRITDQDAPFGTGTVTTSPAPAYNRIVNGAGETLGFRMVVRVDNNRCYAEILPVAGDVTPDPTCGFHEYSDPTDDVRLSFIARHPNGFATYGFATNRAAGPAIAAASTSGVSGAPGVGGFSHVGGFTYQGDVSVATLLGACANAAFGEHLDVNPMATNGYSTLSGYRHSDTAAFALAVPCPPCECEEEEEVR